MAKLAQKQQKYLNHFDAEPPGDCLTLISWSFIEYSDCITSGSKGPCVILGRKKKRFSSCNSINSMGVIPDEPEFFSSLLKLQLTCRDHGFIWFSSNYSSEIYFITNCTWRYMEAISNLIGPLGMIKSVNLNWATYSPGIKDKKQQAVRENWWKGKGRKGWGWWEWGGEGKVRRVQLHILICRQE